MPVICTGRQPNSDVYVIGPELQFNSDGTRIAPERQQYIWIPQVLQKLHVDKVIAPHSTIPEVYHPLRSLLKAMKELSGDNFLGSIYMLGECILHATCVFDFISYWNELQKANKILRDDIIISRVKKSTKCPY